MDFFFGSNKIYSRFSTNTHTHTHTNPIKTICLKCSVLVVSLIFILNVQTYDGYCIAHLARIVNILILSNFGKCKVFSNLYTFPNNCCMIHTWFAHTLSATHTHTNTHRFDFAIFVHANVNKRTTEPVFESKLGEWMGKIVNNSNNAHE